MSSRKVTPRRIIVTGGSGGIGGRIVARCLEEGADVVNIDVALPRARAAAKGARRGGKRAAGGRLHSVVADLADPSAVTPAFAEIDEFFAGRAPDALVCAAAIGPKGHLLDVQAADIDRVMAINVRGTLLVCQQAAKRMQMQRSGRIVVITSIASLQAWANEPLYCISKAAQMAIVQTLAVELAPFNVLVNGVGPGIIDTSGDGMSGNRARPEIARHYRERIPLDRFGTPTEVAEAVWFLTGATYMTGQTLYLDGGFMASGLGYFGSMRAEVAAAGIKRRR